MKNINNRWKRNCLCIPCDEFEGVIYNLYQGKVEINYDTEGCGWYPLHHENVDIYESDVMNDLAGYFGVKEITSIHTDNYSPCCFWISYKE